MYSLNMETVIDNLVSFTTAQGSTPVICLGFQPCRGFLMKGLRMDKRRFCIHCSHIQVRGGDVGGGVGYFCKTSIHSHANAVQKGFSMKECSQINKNNDCRGYNRKWWHFFITK